MKLISRRAALSALAAAPVLSSNGLSTGGQTDDVRLLHLESQFIAVAAQIDGASDGQSELTDELLNHLDRLEVEIVATPARSIEGLCVKARAACWALLGDLDPAGQPTTDKRMALSIVRDLIRLYDPGLERPSALTKLVEGIESSACNSVIGESTG